MARGSSLKDLRKQLGEDVRHVAASGAEQIERTRQFAGGSRANLPRLPHAQIHPDPDQPRRFFEEPELDNLARSILAIGLQEPLRVYADEHGGYRILDGERRWRALARLVEAGHAEYAEVPVLVDPVPERTPAARRRTRSQQATTSLLKNLHTPLELAAALQEAASYGREGDPLPAAQVAKDHGFEPSMVERHLRVARGLRPDERAYIQEHYPRAGLDPLDKLVGWLAAAGSALDEGQRRKAIEVFAKKRPSARVLDAVLAPLAPKRPAGRPKSTRFRAGRTRDGGFSVTLTIPGERVRDPAVINGALRDLEVARERLETMRAEQGREVQS